MKVFLLFIALIFTSTFSFANCTPSGNQTTYGTNNVWIGYVYTGINFNTYQGHVNEGSSLTANFDESFGGVNVIYPTSDCSIKTDKFSVRYKLKSTLANGYYTITVGGDAGYRLSLDGGATYVINNWNNQLYNTTTYTANLSGSYNMVLEYFDNDGANRISFNISSGGSVLPITLINFKGVFINQQQVNLTWATMMEADVDHYEIERSGDGMNFQDIDSVQSKMQITTSDYQLQYDYTDTHPLIGTSYYRVKVIGKNGHINETPVVMINNDLVEGSRIYPTLIQNNMVFVESNKILQAVKIEFFTLSGKKISETDWTSLNGRQNVQVSKSGILPSGTYVARLTANGQNVKNELVIVQSH